MADYLSPETIRLGFLGLGAGLCVGAAWRAVGRARWGAWPFVIAFVVCSQFAARSDWPRWDAMTAAGALVTALACLESLTVAEPHIRWGWVVAGALASAGGVWAGVPETGPAVLAGACIAGLAGCAALTGSRLSPTAGAGMAALVGWAALSGASGRPWAVIGGTLCTGVAPWFALRALLHLPTCSRSRRPAVWLLVAHTGLVILASRWVAVNPHAGWGRAALLAMVGLTLAAITQRERA